jgi:hypothetical protein
LYTALALLVGLAGVVVLAVVSFRPYDVDNEGKPFRYD